MTAGVLVSPALKLHGHADRLKKLRDLAPLPRNHVTNYTTNNKFVKPSSHQNVKLKLKIDLKGKRNPNLFKTTIRVKLNRSQIKQVLVKQILIEERSSLRMLGVAVFYSTILKTLMDKNESEECSDAEICPLCHIQQSSDDNEIGMNLLKKLERDVKYLLDYAMNAISRNEKQKYFHALQFHGLVTEDMKDLDFLKVSEQFVSVRNLLQIESSGFHNLSEIVQGKKEALRLLKMQALKSRKCGVCDTQIENSKFGSVLAHLDKKLASF